MELVVVEGAFGLDIAGALGDGNNAVGDNPLSRLRAVLRGNPFVEIFAIEKNDGIGRGLAAFGGGRDDFGLGLPDFSVLGFGLLRLGERGECEGCCDGEKNKNWRAHGPRAYTQMEGVRRGIARANGRIATGKLSEGYAPRAQS